MITQAESGLTTDEYAALAAENGAPVHQIIAHQWDFPKESRAINLAYPDWDTLATHKHTYQGDNYVFVAYNDEQNLDSGNPFDLIRYDSTNTPTILSFGTLGSFGSIQKNSSGSFASDGDDLYFFSVQFNAIKRWVSTDNGASWTQTHSNIVGAGGGSGYNEYRFNVLTSAFGSASASTTATEAYDLQPDPGYAFDSSHETWWSANAAVPQQLIFQFGESDYYNQFRRDLNRYDITCNSTFAYPTAWTFEGSNNGSTWTVLDTQTAQTFTLVERKSYTFNNSTSYDYYRLNISAKTGSGNTITVLCLRGYNRTSTSMSPYGSVVAINKDRAYYVSHSQSAQIWTLMSINVGGSPVATNIASPYRFQIDAVDTPDGERLILYGERPGGNTVVMEGNEPSRKAYSTKGVWSINGDGTGVFSNPRPIYSTILTRDAKSFDTFPIIPSARISYAGGKLWVFWYNTLFSQSNARMMYATSVDGKNWSLPQVHVANNSVSGRHPVKLYDDDPNIIVAPNYTHFEAGFQFGYENPNTYDDITDYVMQYNYSQQDIGGASFTLSNGDGHFDNHAIVGDRQFVLEHRIGRWTSEGLAMYTFAYTKVDDIRFLDDGANRVVQISSRDFLGRMADEFVSMEHLYWEQPRHGVDTFEDNTGTGYGGLSHFAIQAGQFRTKNGELQPRTTLENIGFSTMGGANFAEGEIEIEFRVGTTFGATAGIIFDAIDRYNYCKVEYAGTASDTIIFQERRFSQGTNIAVGSTLGWSTNPQNTFHWLKIKVTLTTVTAYVSTDGINWTTKGTVNRTFPYRSYYNPGYHNLGDSPLDNGFTGIFTQGRSPRIRKFTVRENREPFILDDAVKAFAALAELEAETPTNYVPPTATTFGGSGSISATETSLTVTGPVAAGTYVTPVGEVNINHQVRFDAPSSIWVYQAHLLASSTNTYYRIYWVGGLTATVQENTTGSYVDVLVVDLSGLNPDEHILIDMQEVQFNGEKSDYWRQLSVYANGQLRLTHFFNAGDRAISESDVITISLGVTEGASQTFSNILMPKLYNRIDWASVDPDESPLTAMERAIQGIYLKYFVRFNGKLKVVIPGNEDSVVTLSDDPILTSEIAIDQRSIKTGVRSIASYNSYTTFDPALVAKYGTRFAEITNPVLTTPSEAIAEASAILNRFIEQATTEPIVTTFIPFLEPEDHITTHEANARILTGYTLEFLPGNIEESLDLRDDPY